MPPLSAGGRALALGCSALALAAGSAFGASFTYTTLPNSSDVCFPTAINDSDVVVGGDYDGTTAFFWENGASTFVNEVPEFYDINASGIATAKDPNANIASYSLYDISSGNLQTIRVNSDHYRVSPDFINSSGLIGATFFKRRPGFDSSLIEGTKVTFLDGQNTSFPQITGLNDSGEAIGYYLEQPGTTAGFSYLNGVYTHFSVSGSDVTFPTYVAADGTIVGYYTTANQSEGTGFELAGGAITTFNVRGSTSTYPKAIGPKSEIVGYYRDAQSVPHGFIYVGGKFYTIDFPGSIQTEILGVNSKGSIIGEYTDAQGGDHPYIAQCAGGKTCTK